MDNPKQAFGAVTSDDFRGYTVDDQPHVRGENFAGVDEMLEELDRRIEKSGRLDEHKDNLRYTKPSEERRQEKQVQAYKAKTGAEGRWRGGVQC